MIWCCPRCHSDLDTRPTGLVCRACKSGYQVVDGIPDLRVPGDSWIDFDDDLATARDLASYDCSLSELVRRVYALRPGWDDARIERRSREVLAGPIALKTEVASWLRPITDEEGPLLDLGCGPGALIAALAVEGRPAIGIDVSMTWLVVAKRLIAQFGGTPDLAAGLGEALPLRPNSLGAVLSLDVIEHVRDPDTYLREMNRVVRPGGRIALSTPNRLSLTAEPHVFVWGVGWLPRPWQAPYVRWRSGRSYDDTRLMSSFGLRSRMRRNTSFRFNILIPRVPNEHLTKFSPAKAALARIYNRLSSLGPMRFLFLLVAPFFRIVGVKQSD